MLDSALTKKINDFVYQKPRTIQEIALLLGKNWRTADRYIEQIAKEQGTLSIRTFREGTRGALKIVFWNNIEKIHSTEFQQRLFEQIRTGVSKKDFSPSDLYQYVDSNKKLAKILTDAEYTSKEGFENYVNLLKSAESQILFFSGNLTFSNMDWHDKKILRVIEDLAERNVSSKILTRIEIPGIENIKNIIAINSRIGKEMIEVRHCFQPLRATVIDTKVANFKEVKDPKDYARDELKERITILYDIYDPEWVEWIQKVFWNLFRVSVPAKKRIEDIESMKKTTALRYRDNNDSHTANNNQSGQP